ncbi:MAG: hypothetical protein J7604_19630 [Sporocytophaga sp.]|uniref:hypothetical protein n=1 Tax=Sporocytophaga sp. TaxID=2231183 RepID=UPI001B2C6340|nr:hypothetical protein [Sporocytophaga sp.]MBO9702431.1 hypothetical protein [Sporocytophaga sp.]
MLRFFFLFYCLILSSFLYGQGDKQIPVEYKVDTIYKPSELDPSVMDTIITYRKVNVVRKEYFIAPSPIKHSINYRLGASAGYGLALRNDVPSEKIHEGKSQISPATLFKFLVERENNKWLWGINTGMLYLKQKYRYTASDQQVQTYQITKKDTVDVYFIENETTGIPETKYVIKERTIEESDTSYFYTPGNFVNKILYLQAGLKLGYAFKFKKWSIAPILGYSIAIPVKADGVTISKEGKLNILSKNQLKSITGILIFETRASYELSKCLNIFICGSFTQNIASTYTIGNNIKSNRIGLETGVLLELASK